MKTKKVLFNICTGWVILFGSILFAEPMGTAFTYQGRLLDDNVAADGIYDMEFRLYDDPNMLTGLQIGTTADVNDVAVTDGYFIAELDFGSGAFNGDARWLQIAVRPGQSGDPNYITLSPRQPITPTPYAISSDWNNLANIPAGFADGVDDVGITSETDPQVSLSIPNYVPKWNGSTLIKGSIMDSESKVSIGSQPLPNGKFYVYTNTEDFAVHGRIDTANSGARNAVKGVATGNTTDFSCGVYGISNSNLGSNCGVYGKVSSPTPENNYGIYGYAINNDIGDAWAGYFEGDGYFQGNVGIGIELPTEKLDVVGTIKATAFVGDGSGLTNLSAAAIEAPIELTGYFVPPGAVIKAINTGHGYGVYGETTYSGYGVYGKSNYSYGVYGTSESSIGVYGSCKDTTAVQGYQTDSGNYGSLGGSNFGVAGSSNYGHAGYFDGKGYFSDNVGIGIEIPTEKLDVVGTVKATAFIGDGSGLTGISFSETDPQVGSNTTNYVPKWNGSALVAGTIYDNGTIGVGTPSPATTLDVEGGFRVKGEDWPGSAYGLELAYRNSTNKGFIQVLDRSSGYVWGTLCLGDGNVLVGPTNQTAGYKLDVRGTIGCTSLTETSDARLKSNVKGLTGALDKIQKIRGVSFEWNQEAESVGVSVGDKQIGVVAQELEAVFPELVSSPAEGYKTVDYSKLSAVLIEAVKEQQEQIETMQAEIDKLKKQNKNN